ncbi:iron-sulfur cluster repair di-iron protein [Emticicia sp. SJ17W-69]|uniref:iron-sulfur cluster repair di-iron protein n=1 Tax=Emticicia sp. SJ17W-69 TaxID=3421657 RepID=UPI003EBF62C0
MISILNNELESLSVGEIVKNMPKAASIFSKLKIDFCCGGHINFVEACQRKGINPEEALNQINELQLKSGSTIDLDFDSFDVDFLVDYIYNVHHKYLYENLPEINRIVSKVVNKHKEKYGYLNELFELYTELEADLLEHLPKEENILFPYTKNLILNKKANTIPSRPFFGTINNPLMVMNDEHNRAGEILHRLRAITKDYTPPADACNSQLMMLDMLKDLDANLIQHIHLENNILFPKIVLLEESTFGKN